MHPIPTRASNPQNPSDEQRRLSGVLRPPRIHTVKSKPGLGSSDLSLPLRGPAFSIRVRTGKLRDSWWEPPPAFMRGGRSASTLPLIMRFSADNAGGFQSVHKGTRINEALEAVKGLRDSYRAMLCNVPQGRLKITEIAQDAVLGYCHETKPVPQGTAEIHALVLADRSAHGPSAHP